MRTIVYTGTLRLASSLSHSARPMGNNHPFRRETLFTPEGKRIAAFPIVSGSVIRGGFRRYAAKMVHRTLAQMRGTETLPFDVVNALTSGGTLRETRSGSEPLTGERQAALRDAIPMLGLFGLSAGGRIMSGRLIVDKGVPVARESSFLAPTYQVDWANDESPSVWQMIQRETYTRQADVSDAGIQPFLDPTTVEERELPKGAGNMIYTRETLSAGIHLFHSLVLEAGTDAEVAFFDDLVARWSQHARVGGQIKRGMGRVVPEYTRYAYDMEDNLLETEPEPVDWRAHMRDREETITEALTWL